MKTTGTFIAFSLALLSTTPFAATAQPTALADRDTVNYIYRVPEMPYNDSIPTITIHDVNIVSFRSKEDRMLYIRYKNQIKAVLPYVKIAKQLYVELKEEKETSKKREYKHYRKDLEKEMRTKFEKELRNLTTGQGKMLFKLINRETGNNAYHIIKEVKGGVTAWFYQQMGKRWGYDLKDQYSPEEEKMIEMIIKELGPAYNI